VAAPPGRQNQAVKLAADHAAAGVGSIGHQALQQSPGGRNNRARVVLTEARRQARDALGKGHPLCVPDAALGQVKHRPFDERGTQVQSQEMHGRVLCRQGRFKKRNG